MKKRVAVFGRCVVRDTLENSDDFIVVEHIHKSSFASAFSGKPFDIVREEAVDAGIGSPFMVNPFAGI